MARLRFTLAKFNQAKTNQAKSDQAKTNRAGFESQLRSYRRRCSYPVP